MARLDDLVGRVREDALRAELVDALRDLRRRKRFGLVFEEHIPETTSLASFPVDAGDVVADRRAPGGDNLYRVVSVTKRGQATVEPLGGGARVRVRARDLLVVKRFGEPVYPGLTPLERVERGDPSRARHVLIEAENFHALQLLVYTHTGEVDCIYIDPPYNTGARDWKYNNAYVDEVDTWRHSKWLSFMEKRLRLAKRLLRADGVLICTIDEHEVHHLGMLLEQVFPEYTAHMVTIVHNPKGTYKKNLSRVDEYAFFVCPTNGPEVLSQLPAELFAQTSTPTAMTQVAEAEAETEDLYLRRRGQESGYRRQRPNQFYAILVDEDAERVVGVGPALGPDEPYEVTRNGSVVTVYPLDTRDHERVWRYSRESMQDYIDAGEIVVTGRSPRTGQGWVLNHRVSRKAVKRVKTVWWEKRHDAGAHGSDLLTAYLGDSALFPFPKSVYAVRDCLDAVVRSRPDALIVDFFAGSGTTLHATCLLNARDGGGRRCIMITNNEVDEVTARRLNGRGHFLGDAAYEHHGIFERVAVPRCRAVLTGRRPDGTPVPGEHVWADRRSYAEGFDENLEVFRMEYLDPDSVDLGRQFEAIEPLLWMAAGGRGARHGHVGNATWLVADDSPYAVLFDEARFPAFRDQMEKRDDVTNAWLVTDSEEAFAEMRGDLPPRLRTSMLYREYLSSFRVNTERNL